ncbi:hypothetical protein AB4114_24310 [Paenibacillus sp. 2RAB27]
MVSDKRLLVGYGLWYVKSGYWWVTVCGKVTSGYWWITFCGK